MRPLAGGRLSAIVSAALLAAAIALFLASFGDEFDVPVFGGDVGPAFMPRIFLGGWVCLSAIALIQSRRAGSEHLPRVKLGQFSAVVLIALATAAAMGHFGFLISAIPGFFMFCWAFGYRRISILLPASVVVPLVIWATFRFGFELLLPRSPWFHTF